MKRSREDNYAYEPLLGINDIEPVYKKVNFNNKFRKPTRKRFFCGPDNVFCGKCEYCGIGCHIKPHPSSGPGSGSWCDKHYEEERKRFNALFRNN